MKLTEFIISARKCVCASVAAHLRAKANGRPWRKGRPRACISIKGFEGGQMPLHMRLPKRGFNVPNPKS